MQVLVVEDDRNLRRFLSKALREEGFGAVEAESGDHALDRALDARYNCIILDVMLPGRDGFDLVTEPRSRARARFWTTSYVGRRMGELRMGES